MEIPVIPNPIFMTRQPTQREVHMIQSLFRRVGYENVNGEVLIDQLSEKHYYISLRVIRALDDIAVRHATEEVGEIYGVRLEVTGYQRV